MYTTNCCSHSLNLPLASTCKIPIITSVVEIYKSGLIYFNTSPKLSYLTKTLLGRTQPAWYVSERSQSDLHWEKYLREPSETSQKRSLSCDVFKTSQIHLKKDVFSVTSLRRLKNNSRKYFWFSKNTSQKWFRVISVGFLQYLIK